MAFENGLTAADMAAVMRGNGNGGWGNDGFGAWWIILFMIFAFMGNGNWGNGYGNGGGVPYVAADVQRGFDQQATTSGIAALQSQIGNGFSDMAVAQCQGNANVTAAITNGTYATAQSINNAKDTLALGLNQLALAAQQGFNDNRAGQADLKYTIATENCADRQAISDGIRDLMAQSTANTNAIVQSQTQGIQNIMDKLCQLELDNVKRENDQLRTQLNMANLAASQTAQTAQILQGQNQQAQYITNTCCPKPVPAYTVPNPSCGCGYNV